MEGKAASDSPAKATPSLGTYQLVVVDHDQLHILGLTVHCRVPPTDLGVGGHLESVPTKPGIMTKPWTDSGGGTVLQSGPVPAPLGWGGGPMQPLHEGRQPQFTHQGDVYRQQR